MRAGYRDFFLRGQEHLLDTLNAQTSQENSRLLYPALFLLTKVIDMIRTESASIYLFHAFVVKNVGRHIKDASRFLLGWWCIGGTSDRNSGKGGSIPSQPTINCITTVSHHNNRITIITVSPYHKHIFITFILKSSVSKPYHRITNRVNYYIKGIRNRITVSKPYH